MSAGPASATVGWTPRLGRSAAHDAAEPAVAEHQPKGPNMLRHKMAVVILGLVAVATTACGSNPPAAASTPSHGGAPPTSTVSAALARQLNAAHAATARYASDPATAVRDGYMIITPMMPGMGLHYLNPTIQGFDPAKPPILVYAKTGTRSHLVALEWVFPEKPSTPPLEGATYGSFDAACHFKDGTFTPAAAESACAKTNPETSAPFTFWHPKLVTLHVWVWLHNPAGLYHPTNALVEPFTG